MKTRLILDINKTQYAQLNSIVTGRVGDKVSNVVDVYVIDSGSPYNLTGLKVFFECAKPDNTVIRDDNGVKMIDAANGRFEYTFPTETFGAIGKAKQAFMSIEKDKTIRATTQDFALITLPDATTNRIPSESYFSDLEKLIQELNEMALEEMNSQAAAEASAAKDFANQANKLSNSIQKQLNEIVIKGDSSVEAAQAREDETGVVHKTLKDRIDSDVNKIQYDKRNLVKNADFETLPIIQSRSSVYSFLAGVTNPTYAGRKSMKVTAAGYEASTDTNKDFAITLTETIVSSETIAISFMVYPSVSNKSILIRMAYAGGTFVNLGPANQWNKITLQLPLSSMSKPNNFLYFDLRSSFNFHMSDLQVGTISIPPQNLPVSINQINEHLVEDVRAINNSKGAIERMLAAGQTYWDNVNDFVYGNLFTAYDTTLDLVGGKHQIDCSSFAHLMIHGIPYNKTRYAGNADNINSGLFFQNINGYKWRFANQIAKFAYEKGYAFKPKDDLSDLAPGDVLFFSWKNWSGGGDLPEDLRENAFMKIDHVGVFLHKKNDSRWATLQFDNGISTVYYDATNEYMSQCVLVARFPYANVESMYSNDNLIIDGDIPKSVTNNATIASYKLTKPLVKGRYYTIVLSGDIITDNCYFVVQANGKTIYSDIGKIGKYQDLTTLRFPYLLDDIVDTVTLLIGAPTGTTQERSANVSWFSIYEGYQRNITQYNKAKVLSSSVFNLDPVLMTDLDTGYAPNYKFNIESNRLFTCFSLTFKTIKTGNLLLGNIGSVRPKNTHRIPINLVGANNEPYNAILQISWNGDVTIITYTSTVQWKHALASGFIFMD
ncbi:BppU family phage baseplate upper protein [Bacillus cereus]|uniref:BppU N-terminal domain-containing protein n=1 Tax=Bacillus cereus HuA4-10 TaxID=1053206 RepID=J8E6E9_BACCE|nr:BppU family phage baseplate upper protein [Bacillus cereus]EJQ84125.1 hypothetical protein IGC_01067 [Bacillus cereus HuA4-10]